jgi:hypothetical protein
MKTVSVSNKNIIVEDKPNVSITSPFEPIMLPKKELENKLKQITERAESNLVKNYPAEKALTVALKLRQIISDLNYNVHKKSIAIFISPVVEKVYYLNIPLKEKIIIDEAFEIKDLIKCKKERIEFLILLLHDETSKMYLGTPEKLTLIKSNLMENSLPDLIEPKEKLVEDFLFSLDEGLSLILKGYDLPIFVMGPKIILNRFDKITCNKEKVVVFIPGSFNDDEHHIILKELKPYIQKWEKIKQQKILQEIERAEKEHKLLNGIDDVCSYATFKNNKLLVIEKDFSHPLLQDTMQTDNPFYIKDTVDNVIEKVLQNDGDAEFVANDLLHNYGRIALIQSE